MINVITVHWLSAKWVPAQLAYLERNMNAPYRVFASLNGIDDPDIHRRFHYAEDLEGKHPEKLDALSKTVIEQSKPTDILMFLDGDAFPVQPLQPWLDEALASHGLVAIQRKENCQDLRPHPSFCATTVKLWKELGCDWTSSPWTSSTGITFYDPGGPLAGVLESNGIDWLPLNRTNTYNPHPLWFAVYGHRLYHHGAGFRSRVSKVDKVTKPALEKERFTSEVASLGQLSVAVRNKPSILLNARPRHTRVLVRAGRKTVLRKFKQRFSNKADTESDEVFRRLSSDERFYRSFDSTLS